MDLKKRIAVIIIFISMTTNSVSALASDDVDVYDNDDSGTNPYLLVLGLTGVAMLAGELGDNDFKKKKRRQRIATAGAASLLGVALYQAISSDGSKKTVYLSSDEEARLSLSYLYTY